MGTTEDNVALVKRSYEQFAAGDMEGLISNYDDKLAVWDMAGETPWSGHYEGHAGIWDFLAKFGEALELTAFEPKRFIGDGDTVVVIGHLAGKAKTTGKTIDMDFVHVLTVKGGKQATFRDFHDTNSSARAFQN